MAEFLVEKLFGELTDGVIRKLQEKFKLVTGIKDEHRKMSRKKKVRPRDQRIGHYTRSQKILLVGEGDFSFSACLARAFGSAGNMVATCLHSEDMLPVMHWTSEAHIETLEESGCLVLYEVDVYNMNEHRILSKMKFDVIVFNFPHAGHVSYLCETDATLIEMHQDLIRAFFKSARGMLQEGGEIHVTHRDDYPYNTWEVEKLAREAGLDLKEKAEFRQERYPGYHNKRGGDINCNKKFPLKYCFTFKFILKVIDDSASNGGNSILTSLEDLHI